MKIENVKKMSTINAKLDKVVAEIVLLRDKKCVICGSTENLQWGHFLGQKLIGTRWNLKNVNCQCAGCNIWHNQDCIPYFLYMEKTYGRSVIMDLYERAHSKPIGMKERKKLLEHFMIILEAARESEKNSMPPLTFI